MAGLADKPTAFFIIPSPGLTGAENVVRVTEEGGAYPGSVVPNDGNLGLLLPLQSGRVLDPTTSDRDLLVTEAGGATGAGWLWKYSEDDGDEYRGVDDPRYFTNFTGVTGGFLTTPGSDNCAAVWSSVYRRVLVFAVDDSTSPSTVHVAYRSHEDPRGPALTDVWTTFTFDLRDILQTGSDDDQITTFKNGTRVAELRDGTLIMVLQVESRNIGPSVDFDLLVLHSTDGGLTWKVVSERVLDRIGNVTNWSGDMDVTSQFQMAVSGDFIRITYVEFLTTDLYDIVSTDRGMTWNAVPDASPLTVYDNGQTSTPLNFTICDRDDSGAFLRIRQNGVTTSALDYCQGDGAWETAVFSNFTTPQEMFGTVLVRALGWVWAFFQWSDAAAGSNDGWTLRRAVASEAVLGGLVGSWFILDPSVQDNSGTYVPARPTGLWAGDRFVFFTANKGAIAGTEINQPSYWEGGRGWNRRSLGIIPYDANFDQNSNVGGTWTAGGAPLTEGDYLPLWELAWNTRGGPPSDGSYTLNSGGTFATGLSMERLSLTTTNAAGQATYSYTVAVPWGGYSRSGRNWGSCIEWVTRVFSGTPSRTDYGVRVYHANAGLGSQTELEVWIYADTVEFFDIVAGVARASINVPGVHTNTTGPWRFRLWATTSAGLVRCLDFRDMSDPDGEWFTTGPQTFTANIAAATSYLEFGNFSKAGAGTLVTFWTEMNVNGLDCLRQCGSNTNEGFAGSTGFDNPLNLLGGSAQSGEQYDVGDGVSIALTGEGGARADQFSANIAHTYAAENVLVDSPRVQWRTIAAPVNTLSSPSEFGGTEWTKNVSGATNTTADNTQTAPDGTVTASRVTYTRVTGGNVIFLRANGADQTPAVQLATQTPYRGYTLTFWMRHTHTSSLSFTMDVSDGPGTATVTVPNDGVWRRYRLNVPWNGNSGVPAGWVDFVLAGYVGGTLITVDLWGMKLTKDPEIILAVDSSGRDSEDYDAVAVFGCNARTLKIDQSDDPNFGSGTGADTLNLQRYPTAGGGLSGLDTNTRTVVFSSGTFPEAAEREPVGEYLYAEDGVQAFTSYGITRQRDRGSSRLFYLDDLPDTNASDHFSPAGGTATSEFTIYGDSGAVELVNATGGTFRYLRVRIIEQDTPDGESYFRIGTLVLGQKLTVDVPLDWAFTDNEQPNVTTYRTRSAVQWGYQEGPPQRTVVGRFVGDWDDRFRDRMRYMLRELSYEVRAIALVLDEDRPVESAILGRVTNGNEQDNAMWWEDVNGVKRTAGDLSLTFVEDV